MAKLGDHYKAKEEEIAHEEQLEATIHDSTQDFITKYKNIFLAVFAGLLLLILGVFAWNYYQGKQSLEAGEKMFQAIFDFEAGNHELALNGNDSLNSLGFSDIISSYGSTDAGNLAKYYAGISNINLGNTGQGIDQLEDFSKKGTQVAAAAYMALAFAYEDNGESNKAAGAFEDAADAAGNNDQTRPLMLFHAARVHESMGNNSKALAIYKKIKKDHPQSTEATTIEKYIGRVE